MAGAVIATVVACTLIEGAPAAAHKTPFPSHPRIEVSRRDVLVDRPVDITVAGVRPGARVDVTMTLDRIDGFWRSQATYLADRFGRVSLARTPPTSGSYHGVDAMGLFWSAVSVRSNTPPPVWNDWREHVHLEALTDGHVVTADLQRRLLRAGSTATNVRARGLVGTLFQPPGSRPRPAVIVVGGSEGGMIYSQYQAAALASHGFATLALAYFDPDGTLGGLPRNLQDIPLEYVGTAIDWLAHQSGVDADELGIIGASRGSELALLAGTRYPQLRAVVARAPSSVAWGGLPGITTPAWTEQGRAIPFLVPKISAGRTPFEWYLDALNDPARDPATTIPVERTHGPVLLINGADDHLWPSQTMAPQILSRLQAAHHPYPDTWRSYPGAGHALTVPYSPTTLLPGGGGFDLGGNAIDDEHASVDAWRQQKRFLHHALEGDR
jgi:dienelactone hydrolase